MEDSNDPNSLYYADDYYYDDGYYYDNYTDYNIADQLGRSTRGRKTKRPKRVRPTRPNRVRPERPVRPKNPKRRTTTTTSTTTTTTTTTKNNPDVLKEVDLTLLYQQYEYENNAQAVQLNADYGEYGDLYGGISNKFGENTLDTGLDAENNLAEDEPEDLVPPDSPETPSPVLEAPVAPPTVTESVTTQEVPQQENEVDESRVAAIVEEVLLNQAQEVSKQITEQKVEVNQINQASTESSQPPAAISNSENAVINQRVVGPPKANAQKPAPIPQRLTPVSAPTAEDQANWPVRQAYSQQRRPVRQNAPIPVQNSGRNYNTPTTGGDPYTTAAPTLKCWHCDAMSFEECEAKGEERPCHANEVINCSNYKSNVFRARAFWKFVSDAIAIPSCKFVWAAKQLMRAIICRIKTFKTPIQHGLNVDQNPSTVIRFVDSVALMTTAPKIRPGGIQLPEKNGPSKAKTRQETTLSPMT